MIDLDQEHTIIAEITPSGVGAVSAIRVSGVSTKKIMSRVFPGKTSGIESHKAFLAKFWSQQHQIEIDQVLALFFEQGHSYTGQDTLEIFCHGNPLIVEQIIQALVFEGCRMSEPGEFTYRSFLNGQIDLMQAEAVASLVSAQSDIAKQRSLESLGGHFSSSLRNFESQLINSLAHLEASIDFSAEDLEIASYTHIEGGIRSIVASLELHSEQNLYNSLTQNGLKFVLIGEPNAGKSTLFNKILGENRSIVTDIAGTTRDVVESRFSFKGQTFSIFDTAGMRSTDDRIEKIGIEQTVKWISKADLVVWVLPFPNLFIDQSIYETLVQQNKKVLVVFNKFDLAPSDHEIFINKLDFSRLDVVGKVTFFQDDKAGLVLEPIKSWLDGLKTEGIDSVSLSQRSRDSLLQVRNRLLASIALMNQRSSPEFVALELREALLELQKVLGIVYDDQVVDKIFKNFCLGK